MATMTLETQREKLIMACKLKAELDALVEDLGSFLQEGESAGCEFGTLTRCKSYTTIAALKAGEAELDAFKEKLLAQGKASRRNVNSSLRLTLVKAK